LAAFCSLLRTGIGPDHIVINIQMPRYTLSDNECRSLWEFLTEEPSGPVVNAHGGPIVPPVPVPDVRLQLADGTYSNLRNLTAGKSTALQLVFTRCTTTCPMQAAIFQRVQHILAERMQPEMQLISLSIDPEQDSPAALREWLGRFEARPGWIGAAPDTADMARALAFFSGSEDTLTSHATQVQIIDSRGMLVWRTNELPAAQSVASLLQRTGGASGN
jgi:protein SCO1/2